MIYFALGFHNHQPVGNFPHIFEEAFRHSYHPILNTLSLFPKVKASFHYSGSLLEWLEEFHPEHLELLSLMIKRGQIEIMGGAFYEPILPVISDRDKLGQMRLMKSYIKKRFGINPKGMWVPERVWEPQLPKYISQAGYKYVVLDDTHFLSSGLNRNELYECYLTEDEGRVVYVFPISKELRYAIPFKPVKTVLKWLKKPEHENKLLVMADDGEKFGVWPDTYRLVIERGWLEEFFQALSADEGIKTLRFSEALNQFSPSKRVYIGTSSYRELSEWSLPVESSRRLSNIYKKLEKEDVDEVAPFLRGGFWRNFLSKYPEANYLHKKMFYVSSLVNKAFKNINSEAHRELYRGQTNCPYWHGVFGGIYLPHLREGVMKALLVAETKAEQALYGDEFLRIKNIDLDADGKKEVLITNPQLTLFFSPHRGGSLYQFDYKARQICFSSVVARREEAYHERINQLSPKENGLKSIHEKIQTKEKGLKRYLVYDDTPRDSLVDYSLDYETTLSGDELSKNRKINNFYHDAYSFELTGQGVVFTLLKEGLKIKKRLEFLSNKQAILNINYEHNLPRLGIGFNLSFLSPDYIELETLKGKASFGVPGDCELIDHFCVRDYLRRTSLIFTSEDRFDLFYYPIFTVSLSEAGLEKVFQGVSIMIKIPKKIAMSLEVKSEI